MQAINTERLPYLNIGCGAKAHSRWHNADLVPSVPGVSPMDASNPLPFSDACMEVVYTSAMIEHLPRPAVPCLLAECLRVLVPGGILRVGVPNFEKACRCYLSALEQACNGVPEAAWDHEWMITEIIDQSARDVGGGEMAVILSREELPNYPFILKRIGVDGETIRNSLRRSAITGAAPKKPRQTLRSRIKAVLLRRLVGFTEEEAAIGRFRLSGEVHRWAYDRFSMHSLLKQAGYEKITVQDAFTSQIPQWESFHLDVTEDGRALKSDLLFVEARKPVA